MLSNSSAESGDEDPSFSGASEDSQPAKRAVKETKDSARGPESKSEGQNAEQDESPAVAQKRQRRLAHWSDDDDE